MNLAKLAKEREELSEKGRHLLEQAKAYALNPSECRLSNHAVWCELHDHAIDILRATAIIDTLIATQQLLELSEEYEARLRAELRSKISQSEGIENEKID